jgi:drug/metabolite transporter (DMT)-like permease
VPIAAFLLVLVSTASHAYWNYVLKRAGGGTVFIALSKVVEVAVFAPLFVIALHEQPPLVDSAPLFVVVGAALVLANYAALGRAYALTDLSLAYPLARGGALLFLPLIGYVALGERLSAAGVVAMTLVVAGMVVMQLPRVSWSELRELGPRLRGGGPMFALGAALATAAYTVWDKQAVQAMPAFIYFYAYTVVVTIAYVTYLLLRYARADIAREWRTNWKAIVQVGVLNTGTYMLVLIALRSGTSSYVVAVRQLSIVWGVLLGWALLGEQLTPPRRIGIAVLVVGCAVLALIR